MLQVVRIGFLYIVKDDILTVLDPVNKIYEQREITDDVEKTVKNGDIGYG